MLIERSRSRLASVFAGALLLSLFAATAVFAQQEAPPQAEPQQAPPEEAQAPQRAPTAPADVGRLEQQIADLQAMVAALESLVKTRPGVTCRKRARPAMQARASAMPRASAPDRCAQTQMGALSSQLELMTQQLGALEAGLGGAGAPQQLPPPPAGNPCRRLRVTSRCPSFRTPRRARTPRRDTWTRCIDESEDGDANFIARSASRFASLSGFPGLRLRCRGADNMAMLHLIAQWRAEGVKPDLTVLTVDHGSVPIRGKQRRWRVWRRDSVSATRL
jgi:hypothetical protein